MNKIAEKVAALRGYHEATKRRIKEECEDRLEAEDIRYTWDLKHILKKAKRLLW